MKRERKSELVSVIISNYNNEKYIEDCLDSIFSQTYSNIELIIVDDFSTDKSVQIIERWIEKVKRIGFEKERVTFLKLPANIGFSGAVTTALFLAKGEFIAMHDGDDISRRDRLKKQVKYLNANKDIGAVGSDYYNFKESLEESKKFCNGIVYGRENINNSFYRGENPVSYGTLMIRGNVFDNVGGLTRKIDGAEDYEFLTKIISFGIENINDGLYFYRNHENQRSKEFYSNNLIASIKDKKQLSVLMVLDTFNIGGTETHVLWIAKELIRQGIKVSILAGGGQLESEFRKLNCKVYNLTMPNVVIKDCKTIYEYKKKIEKIVEIEKINIVHLHQSPSGSMVIQSLKDKNIPFIFTIHGMYYYDILSTELKLCNKIISVSIPVFNWLMTNGLNSNIVPNGINYELFKPTNSKKSICDELKIDENEKIALYCSRMAWGKIKTCENLIRVCRDLSRRNKECIHGLIVGDGPGYESLKKVGDRANEIVGKELIHFVGNQINVAKYYDASDIVVGTGRVAIEAIANQKPVIATGNNGYFGLVTANNFDKAWEMYFGDHSSLKSNSAMYLYDDMKKILLKEKSYDTKEIFDKSINLFEVKNVTDKIIKIYLDAWK